MKLLGFNGELGCIIEVPGLDEQGQEPVTKSSHWYRVREQSEENTVEDSGKIEGLQDSVSK